MAADNWRKQDETERQLVALTAQLELIEKKSLAIEKKNKTLQDKLRDKIKAKKDQRTKGNSDKSNRKKKTDAKWLWKSIPPGTGEAHTKTIDGKEYHWCKYHKKWTLHKPEECRLKDQASNQNEGVTASALLAEIDNGSFADL